ncbi:hypothetical protein KGM_204009 [Danaus plexippus plexippus]|uniref:Uncharacterized protein n=1 Tax=Danaus plexippus plexippus TaxID=278856 RepID=A0A212FN49_DANPL|nr:hypothetical protein KGM_204009 [Danaus plexippus plexippus]
MRLIFSQTGHAMKLVYTLTKPADVTRGRVLELIEYAKKREAKKVAYSLRFHIFISLNKEQIYHPKQYLRDVTLKIIMKIYSIFK